MRIMVLIEHFYPHIGGAERVTEHLLRGLVARGHDACLVTNLTVEASAVQDWWEGVLVYRFPVIRALTGGDVRAIGRVAAQLRALRARFHPDVVHVQFYGPIGVIHNMVNHTPRLPTVVEPHTDLTELTGGALRRILDGADVVVTLSEVMEQDIATLAPALLSRTRRIPYGIAVPPLAPAPLPFDPPVLLFFGRLVAKKGVDLALATLAQARSRYPALRLLVAGDGPERAALEAQAADLGIADAVDFLGWIAAEEIPALINRATVVLVPSRWEDPSPVVLRETALMARPVIAAHVGGIPELVVDGETGLLVPQEDVAAMTDALFELLAQPDRTRRIGHAARTHALDAFERDRYVDSHLALYAELVAAAEPARTWKAP